MQKQIFPKITALALGILTVAFLAAFYVVAWQEPAQAPPGGNVPTPINVGTNPQAKAGRFSATEFYDYNDPTYYLNPSGESHLWGDLVVNRNIYSANWPVGIPSGMIAMFDTACPAGWTRFTALDNRFPFGASSYGGTGGTDTHTHTYTDKTFGNGMSGIPQFPGSQNAESCSEFPTNIQTVCTNCTWGGQIVSPICVGATRTTVAGSNIPPYVGVVWCKKN